MVAALRWRLSCPLVWRQLDGEWLVYASGSNTTHLLDQVSAQVLLRVEDDVQVGHGALVSWLATLAEEGSCTDLSAVVDAVTRQLVQCGLIVQVRC